MPALKAIIGSGLGALGLPVPGAGRARIAVCRARGGTFVDGVAGMEPESPNGGGPAQGGPSEFATGCLANCSGSNP